MNAARIWVLLGRLPLRVVHQIRWSGSKLITRAGLCRRLVSRTYAGGLWTEPTRAACAPNLRGRRDVAQQRRGVSRRAHSHEGQVRVRRVGLRGQVPVPVSAMVCPGPQQY